MEHEQDMTKRHYRPAQKSPWCGAKRRVRERIENGEEPDKFACLRIPMTTDISRVECPACRNTILKIVAAW